MSLSFTGRLRERADEVVYVKSPDEDFADEAEPKFISLNVFHWPQLGHLPIHLADSCPQLLQTYAILDFAICTKVRIFFVVTKFIVTFAL